MKIFIRERKKFFKLLPMKKKRVLRFSVSSHGKLNYYVINNFLYVAYSYYYNKDYYSVSKFLFTSSKKGKEIFEKGKSSSKRGRGFEELRYSRKVKKYMYVCMYLRTFRIDAKKTLMTYLTVIFLTKFDKWISTSVVI